MPDVSTVVVDASVVVQWYVPEAGADTARSIRDRYIDGEFDLLAPSLLPYEVLNALASSSLFEASALDEAATSIAAYGVEFVPFDRIDSLATLTTALDITIYDGAYLALAHDRETTAVTTDKRLLDAARGTRYEERVEHLADFED